MLVPETIASDVTLNVPLPLLHFFLALPLVPAAGAMLLT